MVRCMSKKSFSLTAPLENNRMFAHHSSLQNNIMWKYPLSLNSRLVWLTMNLLTTIRHELRNMQGGPKIGTSFLYALTLPNINWFSKLFHCQNQEKIFNNTVTKDPITPHVCRYTTFWNVKCLKRHWQQDASVTVTTHFKKLLTGNNVFIVSVIV